MKSIAYIFSLLLVLSGCTGTSRQPQLVATDSLLNQKLFNESTAASLEKNLMNILGRV